MDEYLEDCIARRELIDSSIVFVHGLNPRSTPGFARATWTHDNGTFWPADLLPAILPEARLLLFSYNSRVAADVSTNGIKQHALNLLDRIKGARQGLEAGTQRPLIFVSHSLGGLVVKQAIIHAKNDDNFTDTRQSTCGLVFFAVPHRGGRGAALGRILQSIVASLTKEVNNDLLESLKSNSLFQQQQIELFRERLEDYQIVSIIEDLPTEIVLVRALRLTKSMIIVDSTSATLELPYRREAKLTVNLDRSGVCRFAGNDNQFEPIGRALKELVSKAREAPATQTKRPPVIDLPFDPNTLFVGRREELDRLHDLFFGPQPRRRATLNGLGGAGKTQIALAFAYEVKRNRPQCPIFWVQASSYQSYEESFRRLASLLGVRASGDGQESLKIAVQRHLGRDDAGEWLLILDNADDPRMGTDPEVDSEKAPYDYLPRSELGRILITTRNKDVAAMMDNNSHATIEVLDSDPTLAQAILSAHLDEEYCQDQKSVQALLQELEDLPLAIVQAAAFIRRQSHPLSLPKYVELLQRADTSTVALLSKNMADSTRYRGSMNAVARTWLVSFKQMQDVDCNAANMLAFMSCLEYKAIPAFCLPDCGSEVDKMSALGTLIAYKFIAVRTDGETYDLHRLVHLAASVWVDEQGLTQASRDLARQRVYQPLWQALPGIAVGAPAILPHAQKILNCYEDNCEVWCDLVATLGGILAKLGQDRIAMRLLARQHSILEKDCESSNPKLLSSTLLLSDTFIRNGHIGKATALLEAHRESWMSLDETNVFRLLLTSALATTYKDTQPLETQKLLEEVLSVTLRPNFTDPHIRVLTQLDLGRIYHINGDLSRAASLFRDLIGVLKDLYGEDDEHVLLAQTRLAGVYCDSGELSQAIGLLEGVRDWSSEESEAVGGWLGEWLVYLAPAYLKTQQPSKAMELLEHSLPKLRLMNEDDHPLILCAEFYLAAAYSEDGQHAKALEKIQSVAAICERTMPSDDEFRQQCEGALAALVELRDRVKRRTIQPAQNRRASLVLEPTGSDSGRDDAASEDAPWDVTCLRKARRWTF